MSWTWRESFSQGRMNCWTIVLKTESFWKLKRMSKRVLCMKGQKNYSSIKYGGTFIKKGLKLKLSFLKQRWNWRMTSSMWTGMFIDVLDMKRWTSSRKVIWLREGETLLFEPSRRRNLPTLFRSIKSIFSLQDVSLFSLSSFDNLFFLIKIFRASLPARRRIFYDTLITSLSTVSPCLSQQSYRPALTFIADFFFILREQKHRS